MYYTQGHIGNKHDIFVNMKKISFMIIA